MSEVNGCFAHRLSNPYANQLLVLNFMGSAANESNILKMNSSTLRYMVILTICRDQEENFSELNDAVRGARIRDVWTRARARCHA